MKKMILAACMSVLFFGVQAQETYNSSGRQGAPRFKENKQVKGFDPHRLIFGGGLSAGFSGGTLILGVSPLAGYRITDRLSAGVRLGYLYNWIKDGQGYINGVTGAVELENVNYHLFSPGIWARFLVWNNIFVHTEFEYNIYSYKSYATTYQDPGFTSERLFDKAPSLLLGLGYRQPVSDNASFVIEVYYDVLQDIPANQRTDIYGNTYSISPYAGRIDFRVGFNIGF